MARISVVLKNSECFECFAGKQPQSMLKTSHRHFYLAKKITFNLLPKVFQAIHSLTKMSCTVRASEQRNFQTKRYWKNKFLKAYNKQTRPKYCAVACQSGSNREWEAYLLKKCSLENPHIQTDMHFQTTIELLLTLVLIPIPSDCLTKHSVRRSPPIKSKHQANRHLVARVFPSFLVIFPRLMPATCTCTSS